MSRKNEVNHKCLIKVWLKIIENKLFHSLKLKQEKI